MNATYLRGYPVQYLTWPPEAESSTFSSSALISKVSPFLQVANSYWQLVAKLAIVLLTYATLGILLVQFKDSLIALGHWGYIGVFAIELVNSASVFLPTPGQTYALIIGVTLNPFVMGLVGGISSTLGESVGYFLGARASNNKRDTFQKLSRKWKGTALIAVALIPAPIEMAGLWAGAARFPLARFFVYVLVGKVAKITTFALAAQYGISLVMN